MKILSLVLVLIGVIALMYGGISITRQRTILDVGGIKATAAEHHTVLLPPIVGATALIGGVVLLGVNKRRMYSTKAA